jgi:hypothetical protein
MATSRAPSARQRRVISGRPKIRLMARGAATKAKPDTMLRAPIHLGACVWNCATKFMPCLRISRSS